MSIKVGIQLYSIRNSMAKNPLEAIENVGKLGYKFVEFANHNGAVDFGCGFGVDAHVMKAKLDSYGMKAVSAHLSPLNFDNIDRVIEYYNILGCENLVNPIDFFENKEEVLKKCEEYNKIGKKLKTSGISYLYHNHFHEFQKFDGEFVIDIMRDNLDPTYMGFELDTYWAMRGGVDPVEVIKKFGKAIKLIHQKDLSLDFDIPTDIFSFVNPNKRIDLETFKDIMNTKINGYELKESIVEIGTGSMDIQSIINATTQYTDASHIILEQDFTRHDEIESIKISMENFCKLNGILGE